MIQDIRAKCRGHQHEQGAPRGRRSHRVRLLARSALAGLAVRERAGQYHLISLETVEAARDSLDGGRVDRSARRKQMNVGRGSPVAPGDEWERMNFSGKSFKSFVEAASL